MTDNISLGKIRSSIPVNIIGRDIRLYGKISSTNDIAMDLGARGFEEGIVIIADSQERGRGRLGRQWFSPPGVNLYMSILLRPSIHPGHISILTMMGALAVLKGIKEVTGLDPLIKWPNDIIVNDKKVAGILTESNIEEEKINYTVLGIGINVNMEEDEFPPDLRMPATSLKVCTGRVIDRETLIIRLIGAMDEYYCLIRENKSDFIFHEWKSKCITLNKRVKVSRKDGEITGFVEDISRDGALILDTQAGKRTIYTGDVTLLEG